MYNTIHIQQYPYIPPLLDISEKFMCSACSIW